MEAEVKKYIGQACYITLSSKAELVCAESGACVALSVSEYKILSFFIEHANTPVYLEELARFVWGAHWEEKDPNSLKSQISRVRGKLEKIRKGMRSCIDTNYGLNSYTFRVSNESHVESEDGEHDSGVSGVKKDQINRPAFRASDCAALEEGPVFKRNAKSTTVRSATFFELLDLGYTSLSIAENLVQNDLKLYSGKDQSGISVANEGSPQQWAEYLSSVPDSFQYLLNDENRIVGNFSMVSIHKEQEIAFKQGLLAEEAFNPAETRDLFCAGDDHILFLLNLSINDEYSTPQNNTLLRRIFLEQLLAFAEEDIVFEKIIVNVFKASHEAFYKQWGFSFVQEHADSGRIYELNLRPYPKVLYHQLNKNRHLKDVNERLSLVYGPEYRQLSRFDTLNVSQLYKLSELVCKTDRFIYPCLFQSEDEGCRALARLFPQACDAMFSLKNCFVAQLHGEVVGLILWHRGPLNWNPKHLADLLRHAGGELCANFDLVCREYFSSYSSVGSDTISIINVCVDERLRGQGIGTKMLECFIRQHPGEHMELFVLDENGAGKQIYLENGFVVTDRVQGFSSDHRDLPCLKMERVSPGALIENM